MKEKADVYKMRLPNPDANAGKSGGYRVIYTVVTDHKLLFILTIYCKKEKISVPDAYIEGLLDGIISEYMPETEDEI